MTEAAQIIWGIVEFYQWLPCKYWFMLLALLCFYLSRLPRD